MGPALAGKSDKSRLIELVSSDDPKEVMPKKGRRLTAEEVGLLRAWIDQGMKWPEGFSFGAKHQPLEPRRPVVPAAAGGITNPIDLILQPYLLAAKVKTDQLVDDRVYARRVYHDVLGLLPPPRELDAFEADKSQDKRLLWFAGCSTTSQIMRSIG